MQREAVFFGLPFPAAGGRRLAALSFTSLVRLPKLLLVFLTGLVVTALASCHHQFEIGLGAAGLTGITFFRLCLRTSVSRRH